MAGLGALRERVGMARRWRAMGTRSRLLAGLVVLAASFGAWRAYHWWIGWSPRVIISGGAERLMLDFSPDGRTVATSGPGDISLWDAATGGAMAEWTQPRGRWTYQGRFTP